MDSNFTWKDIQLLDQLHRELERGITEIKREPQFRGSDFMENSFPTQKISLIKQLFAMIYVNSFNNFNLNKSIVLNK